MTLTIGGVDITPYIAFQGLKWQRADIDGPDATRTLDGTLVRSRIATKIRLDITCRPLTTSELAIILNAIQPEWVTVVYSDPMYGGQINTTKKMYSNNFPVSYLMQKTVNGTTVDYWTGLTFPLIEQ